MRRPESPSALVERRERLPGLLELWCAFLRPGEVSWAERSGLAALSTAELERLRGLRAPGSRRLFLAGRGLATAVLARGGRGGEGAVRLELGPHGKPQVAGGGGVEFNLTHTGSLVACAVGGGGAVGVDAESFGRAAEVFELRGEFMAPRERRVADGLPGGEALHFGLTVWTLKESYFKAVGTGLELPLDAAAFERKLGQLIAESKFEKKVKAVTDEDFTKSFHR